MRSTEEAGGEPVAARKRAVVEMISRDGPSLKRTARRYSLCAEDAEDAYQRALEIVLTKAPTDTPRELIRWTQVVTKHEALAVRRNRERLLGSTPAPREDGAGDDWVALIPAAGDGPGERAETAERVARSREALRALKPAELRALTLLAEGYSYTEIGEITGFSRTKVNRCLAEGRERFRSLVSGSEDGSRCREMLPLLSRFCDGEESVEEVAVREHLRACPSCRATLRAYRGAAGAAAALSPALPASRSLLDRAHEVFAGIHSRLPGSGGATDSAIAQLATSGGSRGAGMVALAKLLAVCAGTAGGAAACVAAGVVPAPLNPVPQERRAAEIEPISETAIEQPAPIPVEEAPQPPPSPPPAGEDAKGESEEPRVAAVAEEVANPAPVEAGAVEYAPPPPPPPPPPAPSGGETSSPSSGSAAGEFGP